MHDADPKVAVAAVSSASGNGGPEVDQSLIRIVSDPSAAPELQAAAASQLRARNLELDPAVEERVVKIAGPRGQFGGAGYGIVIE
jgi:hypothetical protein